MNPGKVEKKTFLAKRVSRAFQVFLYNFYWVTLKQTLVCRPDLATFESLSLWIGAYYSIGEL